MTFATHWKSVFPFWVAASLVISPFLVFPLSSFHNNQRLLELYGVIFALIIIALRLINGSSLPSLFSRPITLLLVPFFLLGLASSSYAYSPRHAFFEWANFLLLLGLSWIVAAEISAKGDIMLDNILLVCGFACAAYLVLEFALYISVLKEGVQPTSAQLIAGYDNYRFFNHVQTISLPMLGLMAARVHDRVRKVIWWGTTALWWMLLFVGVGRGTFLGLTVGIAFVWCTMHETAGAWCRSMVLAGLAGFVAYWFFYVAIPLIQGLEPFGFFFSSVSRTIENPTSGRLHLWTRALDMIHENPWLGAGPVHFSHYGLDLKIAAHPHNWALQIASEWGIPALFFLSGVLALAMRRLWQLRKATSARNQNTLAVWLVTGSAILVDGLVSGLIVMPASQLWIALYVGCAWGWTLSLSPSVKTIDLRPSVVSRAIIIFATLLMIYALANGIWPELRDQNILMDLASSKMIFQPRILHDGNF